MFLCQKPDFIVWIIVDIWEHSWSWPTI